MIVQAGQKTVAKFCEELADDSIVVNRDYQRQAGVWPSDAQSFLVETILLGYPVPKLTLYEHTDLGSKKTAIELVDASKELPLSEHSSTASYD